MLNFSKIIEKMKTSKGQIIVLQRRSQPKCQDPATVMPDNKDLLKLELRLLLADIRSSHFTWVSPVLLTQVRNPGEGSEVLVSGFWVIDTEDGAHHC